MIRTICLAAVFISFFPYSSFAYEVTTHSVVTPYEVVTVPGTATEQQFVVGELIGYPQTVEITSDTEFMLHVELRALPSATTTPNFAGIVVEVLEPRGVAEVTRLKSTDATWQKDREPVSGLSFLTGPIYEAMVPAGTYNIEVSTPDNYGKYILVIGTVPTNGSYGDTWSAVSELYEFYGAYKIGMIRSPLIYYPLGIILLLSGIGYTVYKTRNRLPQRRTHA